MARYLVAYMLPDPSRPRRSPEENLIEERRVRALVVKGTTTQIVPAIKPRMQCLLHQSRAARWRQAGTTGQSDGRGNVASTRGFKDFKIFVCSTTLVRGCAKIKTVDLIEILGARSWLRDCNSSSTSIQAGKAVQPLEGTSTVERSKPKTDPVGSSGIQGQGHPSSKPASYCRQGSGSLFGLEPLVSD